MAGGRRPPLSKREISPGAAPVVRVAQNLFQGQFVLRPVFEPNTNSQRDRDVFVRDRWVLHHVDSSRQLVDCLLTEPLFPEICDEYCSADQCDGHDEWNRQLGVLG